MAKEDKKDKRMTFEEWWNTNNYPGCCLLKCKRAFNTGKKETEKENTELKDQLTKAKELIKTLLFDLEQYFNIVDFETLKEHKADAEQFLKADIGTKNYEEQDKILKTRLL